MSILHPLLQPFEPSEREPFDLLRAGHLLNRAGFGGTPEEIQQAMADGPAKAVARLLRFCDDPTSDSEPDLSAIKEWPRNFAELEAEFSGKGEAESRVLRGRMIDAHRIALERLNVWWLQRMIGGPHPLQEKLALFWHGHFTSSSYDVWNVRMLWRQNQLLRERVAGNFRDLVRGICHDSAMLEYLDNTSNCREHPNENFARELLELFTLGIGNYSEDDVRETARAFTGWRHDGDQFFFDAQQHDDGDKKIFARRGNLDGNDVVGAIFEHPAFGRYIVDKLVRFFVGDHVAEPVIDSLVDLFRTERFSLRPVLVAILTSKLFYSLEYIGGQIKSPLQLVAGTLRLTGGAMPEYSVLRKSLYEMGQVPFLPPDVKGWPGGKTWITPGTLFIRHNTAIALAENGSAVKAPLADVSAEAVVDEWVGRLIQRPIEPGRRTVLIDAVQSGRRDVGCIRQMVQLIVTLPEYQLC